MCGRRDCETSISDEQFPDKIFPCGGTDAAALRRERARAVFAVPVVARAAGVADARIVAGAALDDGARGVSGGALHRRRQVAADGERGGGGIECEASRAMLFCWAVRIVI